MAASVWMKLSYGPWLMCRPLALTIPAVTVFSRPNGLPMATTHSPTRSVVGVAERDGRAGPVAPWISISAMSVFGSRPTTFALNSLPLESLHDDLVGVLDDVVVGEDVARGVDRRSPSRGSSP